MRCRWCAADSGRIVLDLGSQPACDDFPVGGLPGEDARHPLRLWQCARCALTQLAEDPGHPEQPLGMQPAALAAQGRAAVTALCEEGLAKPGDRVREFGSPHGGSWLEPLTERGLRPSGGRADLVVDNFGLMHEADQRAALRERAAALAEGGTLVVQFHSLATIVGSGQWTSVRHGHFAYYSARVLIAMLAEHGLDPVHAETFPLYGGTVLLAARAGGEPDATVAALLDREGAPDPALLSGKVRTSLEELRTAVAGSGRVLGYGAASRAVALLAMSGITERELPAIADASPAKHGRRMPGSGIPIVAPQRLADRRPDTVLLFLPELLDEVRAAYGDRWHWRVVR
ncbi:methyltransferase domain-containing protein [Sciscionella sediminilitoris]|uniref:methyltransferase domain-containing protein n=1 Tax=Sciscionella sediminilitoris TaxID=1445613 RepID=UPI0004DF782B|nr:methyltransferase domain-containing protein [Sciscionella sp. SE31]